MLNENISISRKENAAPKIKITEILGTLLEIGKNNTIPVEQKGFEQEELLKTLTDKNLFDILHLIRKNSKIEKHKGDDEALHNSWLLHNNANFVFGKRESSAYGEISDLKDEDLKKEILNLPLDVQNELKKIHQTGKEYTSGSSDFWGIDGPKEKIPLSWNNIV